MKPARVDPATNPVVITVSLTAKPGRRDDLLATFTALCDTADTETGTSVFAVHTVDADPDGIVCYEVYRDRDALGVHQRSEAVAAMVESLGDLIAQPPTISYLSPVRVKGIPGLPGITMP
jgi:quinol monooxygenase YgiN